MFTFFSFRGKTAKFSTDLWIVKNPQDLKNKTWIPIYGYPFSLLTAEISINWNFYSANFIQLIMVLELS